MNYLCLNGEILPQKFAQLSFDNRAFRFGEAIVEEMRATGIRVPFFKDHFKRFSRALEILGISYLSAFSEEELLRSIELLVHRKKLYNLNRIRLTLWRQDDAELLTTKHELNYLIEAEPLGEKNFELNERGFNADIFPGAYKAKTYLSPFQTNDLTFKFQALRYAEQSKLDTCFICNPEGKIVEAIDGNIFFANGKTIYTPSADCGCTDGIMRKKVMEIAEKDGYIVTPTDAVSLAFIKEVEEIFITNDLYGIRWIGGYKDVKRYRKKRCVDFVARLNRLFL